MARELERLIAAAIEPLHHQIENGKSIV